MNKENRNKIKQGKENRRKYSPEILAASSFKVIHADGNIKVYSTWSGYKCNPKNELVETEKGWIPLKQSILTEKGWKREHQKSKRKPFVPYF